MSAEDEHASLPELDEVLESRRQRRCVICSIHHFLCVSTRHNRTCLYCRDYGLICDFENDVPSLESRSGGRTTIESPDDGNAQGPPYEGIIYRLLSIDVPAGRFFIYLLLVNWNTHWTELRQTSAAISLEQTPMPPTPPSPAPSSQLRPGTPAPSSMRTASLSNCLSASPLSTPLASLSISNPFENIFPTMRDPLVSHQMSMVCTVRYRLWLVRSLDYFLTKYVNNPETHILPVQQRQNLFRVAVTPHLLATLPFYPGNPYVSPDGRQIIKWDLIWRTADRYMRLMRAVGSDEILWLGDWSYTLKFADDKNYQIRDLQQTSITYLMENGSDEEFGALLEYVVSLQSLHELLEKLEGMLEILEMLCSLEEGVREFGDELIQPGLTAYGARKRVADSLAEKIWNALKGQLS